MTEKSGFPRVHHTPSQQQNFSSDLKAEKARAREEDLSELLMVKEEEVCGFARKLTPVRLAMRRRADLFPPRVRCASTGRDAAPIAMAGVRLSVHCIHGLPRLAEELRLLAAAGDLGARLRKGPGRLDRLDARGHLRHLLLPEWCCGKSSRAPRPFYPSRHFFCIFSHALSLSLSFFLAD